MIIGRKIIQAEIDGLFSLPKVTSAKTLKAHYSMLVDSLESLKGLKIDTSSWDPFLNKLVLRKLDHESIQLFEQQPDFTAGRLLEMFLNEMTR